MKKFNTLFIQILFVMFLPAFLWAKQTPLSVFNQKIKSQALVTQKVTQALSQKLDPQYFKVQVKIDLAAHSLELQKAHINLQLSEALPKHYRQQLANWLTQWVEQTYGVAGEAKIETLAVQQPAIAQEITLIWADILLLVCALLVSVAALSRVILKSRAPKQLSFAFARERMQAPAVALISESAPEDDFSHAQLPLVEYTEPQTSEILPVVKPVFAVAAFNEALDFDETDNAEDAKFNIPVDQMTLAEEVVHIKPEMPESVQGTVISVEPACSAEQIKPFAEMVFIEETVQVTEVTVSAPETVQTTEVTVPVPEAVPALALDPVVVVEPFIEQAVEIVSPYAFIEQLSNHNLAALFFYLTLPQQVAFLMKAPRPTVQRLTSSLEKQVVTQILTAAASTAEALEEELLAQLQQWQETAQHLPEETVEVVDQDAEKYLRLKEIWSELPRKEKVELLEQLAQDNAKLEKFFLQGKEDINSLKYWPTEKLRKFCLQARSRELAAAIKVWPFLTGVILPVCPQTMKKEIQFEMITMDESKLELNFSGFVASFDRFITKATQKSEANLLQIKTKLLQ